MSNTYRDLATGLILISFFFTVSCAKPGLTVPSPHSTLAEKKSLSPESPYQNIEQIEEGKIIHIPTGLEVSEERLIDLLTMARIAYVGEVHDSLEDHRIQLNILKDLWERFPGKIAVGMEMFRRPSQPKLDEWVAGRLSDKDFLKIWYENWGVNEDYYKEILAFIQEKNIPLIALNASQEMEIRVKMKGIDGLSEKNRVELPQIDREDPYHRQALEAIFKGHGSGTKGFDVFYDTMLLWDETMAESIVNYLTSPKGSDKRMVVFAGGFHVGYGFGIPRRVFRRLPDPYKIIIPYAKDFPEEKQMLNVKAPDLPLALADFVWSVAYRELANKKVRLGIFIEPFQAGIRVTNVLPKSSADVAGILTGDIIVSFDGQIIDEPFDLTYAVGQKAAGDRVKLKIIRDGKSIESEVVLKSSSHP